MEADLNPEEYVPSGTLIKVGDVIRHKNDHTYLGICTKISIPTTSYGKKNNICFPYLNDNKYACGTTLDNWESVIKK